ncbi:hypothetical protein LTR84_007410 [Exophiala bonariae]|uniref:Uncharacterized protein n=1 Tax=Exophiala bonariae TaxID=1690606 RepID=A0AAV9N1E9_9EURO|nr:hypothetical protein LTR84_007410 [Exophiala bonariae]
MDATVREVQQETGQASSANTMEQQGRQAITERETRRMLRHVGLEGESDEDEVTSRDRSPDHVVLFFVELAPNSTSGGAKCRLPCCTKIIRPGIYRVAVNPGTNGPSWLRGSNKTSGIVLFSSHPISSFVWYYRLVRD